MNVKSEALSNFDNNLYEKQKEQRDIDNKEQHRVSVMVSGINGAFTATLCITKGIRVTDFLNDTSKQFIPFTNITLIDQIKLDVAIVNISSIVFISPI